MTAKVPEHVIKRFKIKGRDRRKSIDTGNHIINIVIERKITEGQFNPGGYNVRSTLERNGYIVVLFER